MSHGRFDNPVVASMAGFWDRFRKQELESHFTEKDRFDGKTVLVTGANSGLGFAISTEIARRGGRVIMACRRQIPEAGEKVKAISGSENVEMRHLDLTRIDSIHAFADGLVRDGIKLDVTVLNAGVTPPKARRTQSGLDEMFLVNYLSNVMLTHLLISSGTINLNYDSAIFRPRIIFISSDSHQGSSYVDYDEFGRYFDYGVSKAIANYSYFKLVLNTYATELSKYINRDGIRAGIHVICPGPVNSNIVKEAPLLLRLILKGIFTIIFKSPAKACKPVVYLAISPDFEGMTNEYLHMFRPKRMDPKVYLPEEGEKLWKRSLELWQSVDPMARIIP
ncbi:MAG TPA: SDR family NAD(P)-dependent oxidoreductase [Bacteroidales bacterium]|nr:SDR family NAD(P)-dependent oxidoreductase [Bacteroidales bacterium]HPI86457.1 SDR family NAD(P)-dependent oxidoreductase [Bacteroidales bacterium]HPM92183.1 SDR family NAD(P)-dependent oxidoreductase [Bacteroidales bacterium]